MRKKFVSMTMISYAISEAAEYQRRFTEIGNANVEKNLADAVAEGEATTAADIGENAYTLAFDAMVDAGCKTHIARTLATRIANQYMGK